MLKPKREAKFDCVVCGSCTVDVLVRPIDLHQPIGVGQLHAVEPIGLSVGGIVSNASITMARLGMQIAGFSSVGRDAWGNLVVQQYQEEAIDHCFIRRHDTLPTSTSVVMIDAGGDRSFIHCQGAPKTLTKDDYLSSLDLFSQSRAMLIGYYPLMPNLLDHLAEILAAIRSVGCLTALDAAGDGGTLSPLDQILPQVDVYFPSRREAQHQTGSSDPVQMIATYRKLGAPGWVGIKLGSEGAVLSPCGHDVIHIPPITPPSPVVDTTGAGDAFFGGLITGLLQGRDPKSSGLLAAATGALSTTRPGATTAADDMETIVSLIQTQHPSDY